MTVLLTAPDRLKVMLVDVHADVKAAFEYFESDVDSIDRPGWLITDTGGQYLQSTGAESLSEWNETYRLELLGKRFGKGVADEYEIQLREIVAATILYFESNQQLQFPDTRGLVGSSEKGLSQVKWVSLQREPATLYRGADENDNHWGCVMTLTITGASGRSNTWVV